MADDMTATRVVASTRTEGQVSTSLLIGVLSLIYTFAFVDRTIMSLLVGPIKKDFSLSDTQMSIVIGLAFGVAMTLTMLPAGFLIDRLGRRGLIASASFGWSIVLCSAAIHYSRPVSA